MDGKDRGFFSPSLCGIFAPGTPQAKFSARFFCSDIPPVNPVMSFAKVFFWGKPFKVIGAVVGLVSVYVVNVLRVIGVFYPTRRYYTVHKPLTPQAQVPIPSFGRGVGLVLSKNFPAARNSKDMVENSILDTGHVKANHVDLSGGDMNFNLTTVIRKTQSV
jgi:hypothetical protein